MQGYKTVVVNGAIAALPLVDMVANNSAIINAIVPAYGGTILSVIGLVNLIVSFIWRLWFV